MVGLSCRFYKEKYPEVSEFEMEQFSEQNRNLIARREKNEQRPLVNEKNLATVSRLIIFESKVLFK